MLLSTPLRTTSVAMPLKKRIKVDGDRRSCRYTDDAKANDIYSTPEERFKLCGVQCENEGLLRLFYQSEYSMSGLRCLCTLTIDKVKADPLDHETLNRLVLASRVDA